LHIHHCILANSEIDATTHHRLERGFLNPYFLLAQSLCRNAEIPFRAGHYNSGSSGFDTSHGDGGITNTSASGIFHPSRNHAAHLTSKGLRDNYRDPT
jgi:hypothetical protein